MSLTAHCTMINHMIYSLYLEVDWPLRWEWVRFPLMNSGVSDTFDLGSTTAITSCVSDPSQVASDLSTRLTWRIPERLHVDNLDILYDTYRCRRFLFRIPVSFIKDLASAETKTLLCYKHKLVVLVSEWLLWL